jgi:hypothetical protein
LGDDLLRARLVPPGRRRPPTPQQIAQVVTAKLKSPVGQPDKAELALRVVVPRAVLERMRARAIRETCKLEALIREILEDAAAR